MSDLVRPVVASKFDRIMVRHYIYLRKRLSAARFFDVLDSFYDMLSDCHTAFFGSAALHLPCQPPTQPGRPPISTCMLVAPHTGNWSVGYQDLSPRK